MRAKIVVNHVPAANDKTVIVLDRDVKGFGKSESREFGIDREGLGPDFFAGNLQRGSLHRDVGDIPFSFFGHFDFMFIVIHINRTIRKGGIEFIGGSPINGDVRIFNRKEGDRRVFCHDDRDVISPFRRSKNREGFSFLEAGLENAVFIGDNRRIINAHVEREAGIRGIFFRFE